MSPPDPERRPDQAALEISSVGDRSPGVSQSPDGWDTARAARYETLVERTAPEPSNPCRCRCLRCVFGAVA